MTVKADKHKVNQITADTRNQQHHTVTQVSSAPNAKPYDLTHFCWKKKSDNICYKCGERGCYVQECPTGTTDGNNQFYSNATHPPTSKVLASSLYGTVSSQIITTTQPPKVVQTIMSESQLSTTVWNTLLTQLSQTLNENKQMKQFVKKYIAYNNRNQGNNNTKQKIRKIKVMLPQAITRHRQAVNPNQVPHPNHPKSPK